MKKIFAVCIALLILSGCAAEDDVFEITERFYVMQFMEIMMDADAYIGRTIRYEGMFGTIDLSFREDYFHHVYRNMLGCCGPEGPLGLEVYLNDIEPLPDGTWVEVSGILVRFEVDGRSFLRLDVTSLVELNERGLEMVPRM